MHIQKLRPTVDTINTSFFMLANNTCQKKTLNKFNHESSQLHDQICTLVSFIEKHCRRRKGSPADLSTPSFRIYLWLRFLSQQENFNQHLSAIGEFLELIILDKRKIKIDPRYLKIKIDFSGYLYRRQTNSKEIILQINEGFISSPPEIKKSIISAAFSRHAGKYTKQVKSFANSCEYQKVHRLVSGQPIANHIICRGDKYNLAVLFNSINNKYFQGQLLQPRLVWSSRRAIRRLGYYHPEINTIAINKKLDNNEIPRLLVEYVLYHEMLHQSIGIKTQNGRRYAHTPLFKNEEKKFNNYKEAEILIKLLYKPQR